MQNRYQILGDEIIIFLDRKDGSVLETRVSMSKLDKLQAFPNKWCAHKDKKGNFYVKASKPGSIGKKVDLHRYLMDAPEGTIVDHRNHNTLDNTDTNLLVTDRAQNMYNKSGLLSTNTSGYTGVWWHKRNKKWVAEIWIDGVKKSLGSYEDKEDAIRARQKAEEGVFI